uniref:PUB domain-containing protein n=1 Tax=Cryptomonas curvata TaxID=233186 RepID=A0A7S0QTY3_9CRYP|mmetsp:Transcript_51468/g.107510  ORF Transcript_51468/g.107510 Transcript_51468/m.107510 type:complete len:176 (+) Transcript_51468:27-554(+)|eukprot:CAMPEP_0172180244 /NCGR_PEP_ID=MMETSP1050-20130122/17098_1 /TAXON_ID=233186 /ORGANISM="Cryptomonas curvata, Strain CCAP979/52" /LENGTH=175 /DNA_ID=CAMNT_0012853281 /DNA_START=27 /DNA_END=554 /DNA_ORIENTATION=-
MSSLSVSIDVVVATNSVDLTLSCLEIIYKYFSNAAKADDKFRRINKANDIYQRRIHCVSGSTEVLKGLGWIDGGDSWTLPSTVTSESATAGAALIQAKIDFLKAEQEKKVAAEREKQQARLREEQDKKAELRGQYAGDKSARKEEGWKAQVSAAAMKDGKDIARVEQSSCGGGCC